MIQDPVPIDSAKAIEPAMHAQWCKLLLLLSVKDGGCALLLHVFAAAGHALSDCKHMLPGSLAFACIRKAKHYVAE